MLCVELFASLLHCFQHKANLVFRLKRRRRMHTIVAETAVFSHMLPKIVKQLLATANA